MPAASVRYRKRRRMVWLIYLAASVLIFFLIGKSGEGDELVFLGTLPILAFFPIVIYTCVLTHKARVADWAEMNEEIVRRGLTRSSLNRFLTDKCLQGMQNGWAEDVLMWLLGIPAILMWIFTTIIDREERPFAVLIITSVIMLGMAYVFLYMIMNRKKQRKLANLYALLFATSTRPEYTWTELASSISRHNAGPELAHLVDRNYMMNLDVDRQRQSVKIIGFHKVPKNAYVCSYCGGASSIPVGAAKICYYCGRPVQK